MSDMTENNLDAVELGHESPSLYTPLGVEASIFARLLWRCSRLGRARLGLWSALQHPEIRALLDALAHALADLQQKPGWKSNAEAVTVVREVHLFLASSFLQGGFLPESAGWLSRLDSLFPEQSERLALRRALLARLREERDANDYVIQAKVLLADPRVAAFGGVVLDTISEVYATIPPKLRVDLAVSVPKALTADPRIACALAQWQCPPAFASKKEARSWTQRISPERLSFAPQMQVDAIVALGRAAEWERNWDTMAARAQEALRLAANDQGATFLLVRSCLHQAGSKLPEELKSIPAPNVPGWRRLLQECALHEQGDLAAAKAVVAALPEIGSSGDLLELDLAIRLLEQALTLPLDRMPDPGVVRQHAELSAQLLTAAGNVLGRLPFFTCRCSRCGNPMEFPKDNADQVAVCPRCNQSTSLRTPKSAVALLPWAEVNVALKEIHCDGDFAKAFQRLESPELAAFIPAGQLAEAARLLAGAPRPAAGNSEGKLLWPAFNSALQAVLGRPEPTMQWNVLRPALAEELADPFLQQFPSLVTGGEALVQAVQLLGGDSTVRDAILGHRVPADAPRWVAWLHARLGLLVGRVIPADKVPIGTAVAAPPGDGSKLGPLLEAVCAHEREIESNYHSARTALAQGQAPKATKLLKALHKEKDSGGVLTKRWWNPLCTYWLGVACIHDGQFGPAVAALKSLVGGLRHHEAIGQLALFSLQDATSDLAAVAARLAEGSTEVPSVRYAQAIMLSRTGRPEEACQLLGSAEAAAVFAGTPYAMAARRLLAAIPERCGNRTEAVRLHKELLASNPGDEISVMRLVRDEGEIAYANCAAGGPPIDVSGTARMLAAIAPKSESAIAQKNAYSLLLDLLNASSSSASLAPLAARVEAFSAVGEHRLRWRQFLAAGLLRAHAPAEALKILSLSAGGLGPPAVERSQSILGIWQELVREADPDSRAEAAQKLEDLGRILRSAPSDDAPAASWRMLAQIGAALNRGETVPPEQWRALPNSPMAQVPFLFQADPAVRCAAAETLLPVMTNSHSPWREEALLLLNALAAWAMEKDDLYLEHYDVLEPVLDELPVAGRDLWTVAAFIRYAKKDWKNLLDHFPDCVADMSDPLVKLIVELASAREAAEEALKTEKKDQALKKIRSVRNNLQDLLEVLASPCPSND